MRRRQERRFKLFILFLTVWKAVALSAKLLQALSRPQQGLIFLAEAEPYLLRAARRIAVETRAGHAGDANFANQVTSELHVVFETKIADVGHDVISTVGRESSKTRALKLRQDQIAAPTIVAL